MPGGPVKESETKKLNKIQQQQNSKPENNNNNNVMEGWSVGQDTGSGVSKNGDHSRRTAIRVYCTATDNFQHT